jgi:3-phosphoshikimate 1-carboxyvinyltransferase
MPSLDVHPIQSLNAEFGVPGDKSISHRAAILGGLANGTSTVRNFLPSEDCVNTLNAMRALGADVEILREHTGHGPLDIRIRGRAMALRQPDGPIDCGNSGTGMRLLAGVLAGQAFSSELFGDASLSSRPMGRITTPLGEMGARITTMGERPGCAPLAIEGTSLRPIHYDMPVASAQVKSAVLLAGLFADGATSVTQPVDTRDHTERLFEAFGILATRREQTIAVNGGQIPRSCDLTVPGDISSAAFWIAAAAAMPGSSIRIRNVGLNPTRTAILDVLSRMGATIRRHLHSDHGEPIGDLEIQGANLHGADLWRANLQGASIKGANLQDADLSFANFEGANLEGADLYGAYPYHANLGGALLGAANLQNANFYGADLIDANLQGTNLEDADLQRANLYGANLEGANLEGANLCDANLNGANLQNANLTNAILHYVTMPKGWRGAIKGTE